MISNKYWKLTHQFQLKTFIDWRWKQKKKEDKNNKNKEILWGSIEHTYTKHVRKENIIIKLWTISRRYMKGKNEVVEEKKTTIKPTEMNEKRIWKRKIYKTHMQKEKREKKVAAKRNNNNNNNRKYILTLCVDGTYCAFIIRHRLLFRKTVVSSLLYASIY